MNQLNNLVQHNLICKLSHNTQQVLLKLIRKLDFEGVIYLTQNYKSRICKELKITANTLKVQINKLIQAGFIYKYPENLINEYNINPKILTRTNIIDNNINTPVKPNKTTHPHILTAKQTSVLMTYKVVAYCITSKKIQVDNTLITLLHKKWLHNFFKNKDLQAINFDSCLTYISKALVNYINTTTT
jgi:hypothetical protein